MSQWTDRIRSHAVWQQLSALGPVLDQASAREGNDTTAVDALERLRAVLALAGKRLAATDPFLTYPGPLDGLNSALQSAINEVQSYISNGNVGHLTNANSHADSALAHLSALIPTSISDDLVVLSEAASSYRNALERHLTDSAAAVHGLRGETDALRSRLTELLNEATTERQRVGALASDHQAQFSTAQEARNREFAEAQTARQDRYASMIAENTQKLSEQAAEAARQVEATAAQSRHDLTALKERYEQTAQQVLDEINDHKRQVEKLVGVIGNLGVTSGYLRAANHARWNLWLWQTVTVGSLIALIAFAYITFLPVVQGTFSWEGFAGRVFLSATVGVLAAYAASQADKFLEMERRNRKLALELEALGPFLAPLSPELQDKFRLEIGDRSFGRQDLSFSKRGDKSPATVIDILSRSKDFRQFVVDIVKTARNQ